MVEITYQMVLSTLQTVGILVGIFYYIMTIRTNQRNQELTREAQEQALETRQVQLYMQILDRFASEENRLRSITVGQMEFDDFEDYRRKWGMDANPEASAKKLHVLTELDGLWHLLNRGLIELDFVPPLAMTVAVRFWEKWGPIEVELRGILNNPRRSEYVEYLYNEIIKYLEEHPELKT
jgi:hypothetical protein